MKGFFAKQLISFKNMGLTIYRNKPYILLTNVSMKSCITGYDTSASIGEEFQPEMYRFKT